MGNATLDSEVESRVQLKIAQTICNSVGTPFCRPEGFLPLDKLQASPGYIRSGRDSPEERHFHRLSPPAYGEGSNSDPESVSKAIPLVIKCVVRYKKYLSKFSSKYSKLPLGNFSF